jgi:hypothetical protein
VDRRDHLHRRNQSSFVRTDEFRWYQVDSLCSRAVRQCSCAGFQRCGVHWLWRHERGNNVRVQWFHWDNAVDVRHADTHHTVGRDWVRQHAVGPCGRCIVRFLAIHVLVFLRDVAPTRRWRLPHGSVTVSGSYERIAHYPTDDKCRWHSDCSCGRSWWHVVLWFLQQEFVRCECKHGRRAVGVPNWRSDQRNTQFVN